MSFLNRGCGLALTSLPHSFFEEVKNRQRLPGLPPAPPPVQPPVLPPALGTPRTPRAVDVKVYFPDQNPELKAAWVAKYGATGGLYGVGKPYHDRSQYHNKMKVTRIGYDRVICIQGALRGCCYAPCTKYHGVLTPAECEKLATAGGFQI